MLRRRTVLALMLVGVVPAFVLTGTLVSSARARREAIAEDWARRGDVDLAAGRPADAADDFRTAGEYARDRGAYRLHLATALVAADRPVEAEAQLQTLWSEAPGDGVINLQLARIAGAQRRVADAVRYYHAAIDGSWSTPDPVASRRAARLELVKFLLAQRNTVHAQVELVALAADPPPGADARIDVASLLVDAGADNRALALLDTVLREDASNARASALAGTIEAQAGDYPAARTHLTRALRAGGLDDRGAALLDTVTRVLELDPGARGITSRERLRRTVRAFEIASAALDRCDAESLNPLRERRDLLARQPTTRTLAGDPDAVDDTLAFAAGALDVARSTCGPGNADEQALQLVFQRRPFS